MKPLKDVFISTLDWASNEKLPYYAIESDKSTNDRAKSEAFDVKEKEKVYFCKTQSEGRGRGSNTWSNAIPGSQLLISFSFSIPTPPQAITAPLMGIATYEALNNTWHSMDLSIKAPNDIYLKDKKTAGLLVETVSQGSRNRLIVGLGLNVLNHPRDVDSATNLTENAKDFISIDDFNRLLSELLTQYSNALLLCQQQELELADRIQLKKALNKCSVYGGNVTDVTASGDIVLKDETISWMNI